MDDTMKEEVDGEATAFLAKYMVEYRRNRKDKRERIKEGFMTIIGYAAMLMNCIALCNFGDPDYAYVTSLGMTLGVVFTGYKSIRSFRHMFLILKYRGIFPVESRMGDIVVKTITAFVGIFALGFTYDSLQYPDMVGASFIKTGMLLTIFFTSYHVPISTKRLLNA